MMAIPCSYSRYPLVFLFKVKECLLLMVAHFRTFWPGFSFSVLCWHSLTSQFTSSLSIDYLLLVTTVVDVTSIMKQNPNEEARNVLNKLLNIDSLSETDLSRHGKKDWSDPLLFCILKLREMTHSETKKTGPGNIAALGVFLVLVFYPFAVHGILYSNGLTRNG